MIKTIEVTQEFINRGTPQSPCNCPIALAIMQHTDYEVRVNSSEANLYHRLNFSSPEHILFLPREAQKFIIKFDCHESVSPFSFPLDIPDGP